MLSKFLFIIFLWKYLLRQWLFFSVLNFFAFSVVCWSYVTFEIFFICFLIWILVFFFIPSNFNKQISLIISCFFLVFGVYLYLKWYFFFFEQITAHSGLQNFLFNNYSNVGVSSVGLLIGSGDVIGNLFRQEVEIDYIDFFFMGKWYESYLEIAYQWGFSVMDNIAPENLWFFEFCWLKNIDYKPLQLNTQIDYSKFFCCTFGSGSSYYELDGLAFLFFLLTVFCFPICFILVWNLTADIGLLLFLLFTIEFLLILVFTSTNLFLFYVFFEMLLVPMSILIINWGSRLRKLKAMYYFFIYTLLTSLFMLIGIFLIYFFYGTTSFNELSNNEEVKTLSLHNKVIWLLLFFALAAKIPMYPFHLWLPEAHVEAPTVGSVLLAALLLKIGGYGFLRILIGCFTEATNYFRTFVFMLALISVIYSSLILLRQIDMKKLIAYSSIAHMNVAVLGLFSNNLDGIVAGLYFLISHGFSSSALFILVGILYERFSTRIIFNYGGLIYLMPKFGFFFFIMVLANFGFPGTANFIAEAGVLISLIEKHFFCVLILFLGILLSVVYSLFLFIRVLFGRLPVFFITLANTRLDLTKREFWVLVLLLFFTVLLGLVTVNFLNLVSLVVLTFF